MAPGQIARNQKPTGSVEGSCFRKLERKSTRQSLRLSKKPAPKESNIKISEDGHKDIPNTPSQNVQYVLKSSVKKITKKPAQKKPTKKASNTEIVRQAHQIFKNELLSTNDDQATVLNLVCHDAVSSIPTIDEPGESVGTVTFNNAGTVQTQSHPGDSDEAEAFFAVVDSHLLQLNPDRKFESPHPFAHVLTQIQELGSSCEFGSPVPSAHDQQFNLDLEIGSPSDPAHIQEVNPTLDFGSQASSPYCESFEQPHFTLDLSLSTPFAHNQLTPCFEFDSPAHNHLDPRFEFDFPAPTEHDRKFNVVPEFGSLASSGKFQQLHASLEFDLLTPPAHITNLDLAFELGSPTLLETAQQYNQRLDFEPPQGFKYFQLQNHATETEKLPSTAKVQVLDPRLQATPLLDFQDNGYNPAIETVFPAINPNPHNSIHPGSSFPIASTLAAQYAYHFPQTDMSASSEDQTKRAPESSSPAAFNQRSDKGDNGLHGDGLCGNLLNGHGLPEIVHQLNHYNSQHAWNINNKNASYPTRLYCEKPIEKSSGEINGHQAMTSSRLVDVLTYNGTGFYPATANNSGLRNAASVNSTTQASIAQIPEYGTEVESKPTGSSIDRTMDVSCSVEAAQRGLWHEAMNKYGIYRPRGVVRVLQNGITQWREHETTGWCNAVKYEDIRGQLLVECAKLGQYTYPREKGTAAEDVTAFHPDQKDWAFEERHLRPDILHQYEKKGYQNPCYPVQIWLYNGAVVLNNLNQPILDFKNMPKAISSQVEGGLQEAITRQDSRIEANDFRVRMPLDPKGRGKNSTPCLSAISMRRSRFRWRAGYLSWTPRTGSDDIKKYLDSILPVHCKAANSTRDFRELRPSEVKRMTLENRGKYLSRAGNRLLSPESRIRSEKTFRDCLRRAEIRDGISVKELGREDKGEKISDSSAEADPLRQPTVAGRRQWMRDMSDQELEEHRKRILPIFAPQCESWKDLDGFQKFIVDSWGDLEEVGAITYDGGGPVLNYEVIRELIKHILDGKRVSDYYLFREYDENAARLLG